MAESTTKSCDRCNRVKPREAFLTCKGSPDGLTAPCRQCIFERAREDRELREARAAQRAGGMAP